MQACLVSVELIWHRIWECGLGARAKAQKTWGCQRIFKSFKIERKEENTLKKNPEGKLILGKILSSPEIDGPSPLQSFWHIVGHLGHGWHGSCETELPLQAGTKSERGRGRSWGHLRWEAEDPEGSGEAET